MYGGSETGNFFPIRPISSLPFFPIKLVLKHVLASISPVSVSRHHH